MKRFAMILLGCALIMGMSQCKKDNTTNNERVRITLTADGGQNSKTSFDGTNFTWTDKQPEYIYVGCSRYDYCIGELTATGDGTSRVKFSGDLSPVPTVGDDLYFFYLGNGEHDGVTSVSFANQSGNLAEVTNHHIAIGHATYDGTKNYSAKLDMAMAIAWFDTHEFKGSEITLTGTEIYTAATIDYKHGIIEGTTAGGIKIGGPNENCYVALLPQKYLGGQTLVFTDNTTPTHYVGRITFKDQIYAGKFYCSLAGGTGHALEIAASQESGK